MPLLSSSSPSPSPSSRYPYPSTLNPAGYISVKLSPDNYGLWKAQMFCLLESQELVGFINGREKSPSKKDEENYRMWVRSDRVVKGWIYGSLTDQVLQTVIDQPTARDVWTKLLDYQDTSVQVETKDRYLKLKREVSSSLPLYKAALVGDWDAAKSLPGVRDSELPFYPYRSLELTGVSGPVSKAGAIITAKQETALHIAVGTGKSIHFVQELVELVSEEALALKDDSGKTALAIAADIGNTEAVKILLNKNPELLYIGDDDGELPLHFATIGGHRDTIQYLMKHTKDEDYKGPVGDRFLTYAIIGGFLDIALDVLALEPYTEDTKSKLFVSLLYILAERVSFFRSGSNFNFAESLIYSCVPVKFEKNFRDQNRMDVESPATNTRAQGVKMLGCDYLLTACMNLNFRLWEVIGLMVPLVKKIQQTKLEHNLAVQLVKCLCEGIKSLERDQAYFLSTCDAITKAASLGIVEVVEGIVDVLPCSVWSYTEGHNIFQIAVMNRSEKVFNLLYQMSGFKQNLLRQTDKLDNNILHMAGQLAPSHKLKRVSGAALQMQRELQWFKEVEKFIGPFYTQTRNSSGETPAMVFTREHAELVMEGEKWIKDTSNSCTIAAALIVTIGFAAAITVPGGTNGDSGLPIFSHGRAFWLFGFSNAISLFSSTTSLLMFLSILTARYAEQDFLSTLPKRLIFGLFTLFLSITTMIIAFSTAAYLVFGNKKGWVIILLAAASCLPIISFIKLQFPLLVDVYRSTYGRGIFGKQSNRPFY